MGLTTQVLFQLRAAQTEKTVPELPGMAEQLFHFQIGLFFDAAVGVLHIQTLLPANS